jgi:non-ribosomal peptide synthetase component F
VDEQVKVAGFRVEPEEVEAVLAAHPGVAAAAVVAREFGGGGDAAGRLRRARARAAGGRGGAAPLAGERLPAFMVPSAVVLLDALPLTAHGKVDRRALPAPGALEPLPCRRATARGPAHAGVAAAWAEVLGVHPGPDDDFWEMGGHSLLAMRVLSRLRQRTGVELPVRALFDAPTVSRAGGAGGRGAGAPAGPRRSRRWGPRRDAEPVPLSFAQARLWFLHQMEPESPFYNIPFAVRLYGRARRGRAGAGAGRDRPPARGAADGLPPGPRRGRGSTWSRRRRASPPGRGPARAPPEWRAGEVLRLMADEAEHPFDLRRDLLLRALLVRHSEREHLLVLDLHHVAGDGWSIGVLFQELAALYAAFREGRPSPLPEPEVQYRDFARWQREWMRGEVLESQLRYWRARLAGAPAVLELPTDRPRPAVQSYRGAVRSFRVEPPLARRLGEVARGHGATVFMALLAGFSALVQRLSGRDDVVVGSPVAGRVRRETEGLIGFFVNTMALRTDLGGDPSFAELLARVRETTLEAYAHQDLPFERVVEELHPERTLAHHPLFQVAFALQNVDMEPVQLPGLVLRLEEVDSGTSKFDLFLEMVEEGDALRGNLEYATDLWEAATVDGMIRLFLRLLEGAASHPERPLSAAVAPDAGERRRLEAWSGGPAPYPRDDTVHAVFARVAAAVPRAPALVWDGGAATYGELDRRSRAVAARLRAAGVRADEPVAVAGVRSPALVAALLGVLRAGAAYVPVDPRLPRARIAALLADCGARLALAAPEAAAALPPGLASVLPLETAEDARWTGTEPDGGRGARWARRT